MSSSIAIKVDCIDKCFEIYERPVDRLKQFLIPKLKMNLRLSEKKYYKEFWALKNISFEIYKGETVGIVGDNGSGKSTLLQIICGTLSPTRGGVIKNGRVAALLELGAGFNPEFTGVENIHLCAAILGMSRREIAEKFQDILDFAGIGDFINQPVKMYSSGMFVRLAFSINIMSDPDIMIVDEALAVGDIAFQSKCMTALRKLQNNGATILFVSHDINSVKSLCSRAILLEHGNLVHIDKASIIAEKYVRLTREKINREVETINENNKNLISKFEEEKHSNFFEKVKQFRYGSGGVLIKYADIFDEEGKELRSINFGESVSIKIYLHSDENVEVSVNYYVLDDKKNYILGAGLRTVGQQLLDCSKGGDYIITYNTNLPLQEGNYSIHLEVTKPILLEQSAEFLDVIDDAIVFRVLRRENGRVWAKVYIDNSVHIERL